MEMIIVLLVGAPLALAAWLIVRAVTARARIEELTRRLEALEIELLHLKQQPPQRRMTAVEALNKPAQARRPEAMSAPAPEPIPRPRPSPVVVSRAALEPPRTAPFVPPVQPPPPVEDRVRLLTSAATQAPPPVEAPPPVVAPLPVQFDRNRFFEAPPTIPAVNWEQFMGVKGFAWIGGLALFLGVAFFVKYSFDNNLIPPQLRMAIGFLTGLGLLVGGVAMSRKNFSALSQTLCGTGVVILYTVTFACHALYHFEFFRPIPTFLLMAIITTAAFVLAVRLNALVVAILGMLGGFLTPILLSTGQDNPLGLFGYVAILDAGLILVAFNRRWHFLPALAALGTAIMEIGWAGKFFASEKYFAGNKILVAFGVLLGFNALWLAANGLAKRRARSNGWLAGSSLGLAALALAFTVFFLSFPPLAQRPVLLFSFVFLIDLAVAALAWLDRRIGGAQSLAGLAVFGLLALWTSQSLTNPLLDAALALYFIFAVFHSALPALLQRRRGMAGAGSAKLNHLFPPLALLLVLVPILKLPEFSFLVWPFVLLVDVLAIALAVLSAALLPVLAVLLLTLAATGALLFKIPADLTGLPASFLLIGAFAVFFVAASVWMVRRLKPDVFKTGLDLSGGTGLDAPESMAALLTASSAVLPFLLLIMATLRLPLANPAPVFGLALLLVLLLLGVARIFSLNWLPIIGLISTFAVEAAWHFQRFEAAGRPVAAATPLAWYLVFYAAFALFPFLFLRKFADKTLPWAAAALAGPAQFLLVIRLVKSAWPNFAMGLLPAAFAIPALASLGLVLKKIPAANKERLAQLAWFGGVALFFITLIFPVQFDRQWITIGWALEGAALLWLFHRVPHPGLRLTGFWLLVAAFARLALNPAVLDYHPRGATPIFNWYLYTYGIVTAALFAGARLLEPPRNVRVESNLRPVLATLGTVLAFLLMNIEIADYFSAAGSTLTFQFTGNFGRDMTYSIAWALFALVLLVCGIGKKLPAARYAAMGLLGVTLLKLFFHDLARLGPLYRIGAFVAVAVVLMSASFAYQKFFSMTAKRTENKDENNSGI